MCFGVPVLYQLLGDLFGSGPAVLHRQEAEQELETSVWDVDSNETEIKSQTQNLQFDPRMLLQVRFWSKHAISFGKAEESCCRLRFSIESGTSGTLVS